MKILLQKSTVASHSISSVPVHSLHPKKKRKHAPAADNTRVPFNDSVMKGQNAPKHTARKSNPHARPHRAQHGEEAHNNDQASADNNGNGGFKQIPTMHQSKKKGKNRKKPAHMRQNSNQLANTRPVPDRNGHSYPIRSAHGHRPSQQSSFPGQNDSNSMSQYNNAMNTMPGLPDFNYASLPQQQQQQPSFPQMPFPQPLPGSEQQSFGTFNNVPPPNDINNNPASFLPFMPPAQFMNFFSNQTMPGPMMNGFPFLFFDPAMPTGNPLPSGRVNTPGGQREQDPRSFEQLQSPVMAADNPAFRLVANTPRAQRERKSKSPEPPQALQEYLTQASLEPTKLSSPQPLLVILDLNGTLIYRKKRRIPPVFSTRAGTEQFLQTLMEKYKVMIWSSSQPETVKGVCEKLFSKDQRSALVVEWGRDKFGLTKNQYFNKVQVYKRLQTVWADKFVQASYPLPPGEIQRTGKKKRKTQRGWDQTNTILIDDSKLKALSEPYNILEIPEFTDAPNVDESMIFPKVLDRLEELSNYDDVSKLLRVWNETQGTNGILDIKETSNPQSLVKQEDLTEEQTIPPLTTVQARNQRKRLRKQEKKAAKMADLATASTTLGSQSLLCPSEPSLSAINPALAHEAQKHKDIKLEPPRSPSPVSDTQSENFLLDRLEESLDSRKM